MSEVERIKELLRVVDQLLGEGGCPWDREQTMVSARKYVLEETCELIEAIDLDDNPHIKEELGDLFYNAVFLCRLAEKEGRATLEDAVQGITEKLVRRHPHVFGNEYASTADEVVQHWETIKQQEKEHRESVLDGIPKNLPALSRAQKVAGRVKKHQPSKLPQAKGPIAFRDEEELGRQLMETVVYAESLKLDPEQALRKYLAKLEREFRDDEAGQR